MSTFDTWINRKMGEWNEGMMQHSMVQHSMVQHSMMRQIHPKRERV
jgi:hypothetical protein